MLIPLVPQWWYDPTGHAGQLDKKAHWNRDLTGTALGYVEQDYTYNTRHQVDTTAWTIPGNPEGNQTIAYTYRDSGAVDNITYPSTVANPATKVVDNTYNNIEQPTAVTIDGQTVGRAVGYDPAGRVTDLDRGTGNNQLDTDYTYNTNTNRLDSLVTRDDTSTVVQDLAYTYTQGGYIERILDNTPGVGQTHCITHDSLMRFYRGWTRTDGNCANTATDNIGPGPYVVQHFYDNIGNISGRYGTGTLWSSHYYLTGPPHAPTSLQAGSNFTRTFTYDASGNRTQQTIPGTGATTNYSYDVQNRLTNITGATTAGFLYNTDGDRVRRIEGTNTNYYLGNSYETTNTGAEMIHISLAGQRVGSWIDGTITTNAGDHLGSASVTRTTGTLQTQRYQPFGQVRGGGTNTLPTDHGYTGQRHDNTTDPYYYGARYYDPIIGHFTQPDTITPDPTNTADWNRYAYVRNSPLRYTDPSGNCPVEIVGNNCDAWFRLELGTNLSSGTAASEVTNHMGKYVKNDPPPGACQGVTTCLRQWIPAAARGLLFDERQCLGGQSSRGGCGIEIAFAVGCKGALKQACRRLPILRRFVKADAVPTSIVGNTIEDGVERYATPGGRAYSVHYLEDTGPVRNIPGSVVDETIDHGQIFERLSDRTIYYHPENNVTVVQSDTTGVIMSVRKGEPDK